jgi:threonine/homoserine/homoserine lactone efflux protein
MPRAASATQIIGIACRPILASVERWPPHCWDSPSFIPAGTSTAQFSLVLGLWFIAETGLWLFIVAWPAGHGARWLHRPAVQRWLSRLTGVVLIGFGIRLVADSR